MKSTLLRLTIWGICIAIGFSSLGCAQAGEPPESLRIHMLSGSKEYASQSSLKAWATHLRKAYGHEVSISHAPDRATSVDGLEALAEAQVLVVFCRRWELQGEQALAIREAIESGMPVLGLRTASHAFQFYQEFDPEVLGGNYSGHAQGDSETPLFVHAANQDHPVLEGFQQWDRIGKLYFNPGISEKVTPLLTASNGTETELVAWTRQRGHQRVFYTSLGLPADFEEPAFVRMLDRALLWLTNTI